MRYASFGDVSTGTLRNEDLLDTFASELEYQLTRQPKRFKRAHYRSLIRAARRDLVKLAACPEDTATDETEGLVSKLQDALGAFAPPYGYFGAHEGDGASFGFYLSNYALEYFDGLRVEDVSEVPRDYRGEVLHVNDHGNVTLYLAMSRGKLREVWGLV